jgi:hypothetical protein
MAGASHVIQQLPGRAGDDVRFEIVDDGDGKAGEQADDRDYDEKLDEGEGEGAWDVFCVPCSVFRELPRMKRET